jgi:hypothetical protein
MVRKRLAAIVATVAMLTAFAAAAPADASTSTWNGGSCSTSKYWITSARMSGVSAQLGQYHSGASHYSSSFILNSALVFHSWGYGWYVVDGSMASGSYTGIVDMGGYCS